MSYSNEAKIANGVPAEVIHDHGAISPETAEAMAKEVSISRSLTDLCALDLPSYWWSFSS